MKTRRRKTRKIKHCNTRTAARAPSPSAANLQKQFEQRTCELAVAQKRLREALEQQTATAEILRVISSSRTNVQPVFDTIVNVVPRLCGVEHCILYRFDGEFLHLVAHHNVTAELLEILQRLYPMRPSRIHAAGRAIIS